MPIRDTKRRMSDLDKDTAEFLEENARAQRRGMAKLVRVVIAGGVSAAVGIAIVLGTASYIDEKMDDPAVVISPEHRYERERNQTGSITGFAFIVGAVLVGTFAGVYRLLGGKPRPKPDWE